MIDIYKGKGFTEEEAIEVVELLFKYPTAFLDIMMIEELGIMPAEAESSPWKGALITFGAFFLLGGKFTYFSNIRLPNVTLLFCSKI
jgi:hypothetical protein